jgi:hypothetical protein
MAYLGYVYYTILYYTILHYTVLLYYTILYTILYYTILYYTILGELVRAGVFEEIYVSFLPVGHTHEDIDQMFSRFAIVIRYHDTVTLDEMAEVFRQAYVTVDGFRPTVSVVESVVNFSDHVVRTCPIIPYYTYKN